MLKTNPSRERLNTRIFRAVHRHNLIYNTCWEDPALDREALQLTGDDRLLVITSAGCNALDYLLAGCGEVNAVDVNPIQNALLELKVAAAQTID
jgi:S-adenosylmethionine-diacylglycerol 3-amino-3-carboxypropyl transferase